jgi:large subunit ribosomal protein L1
VDRDNLYTPLQAAKLAKETSSKKQDATVEVAVRLGVDPRKADQMVRGTVNLPHGTGKTARVLGPRGLMPNPKTGTVTPDVAKAVTEIKGGKINFRVDKQANLHFVIGKASFEESKLAENYGAALDEILRAKPSSSKGRYLKKITVSTTTGPGIPVDTTIARNFTEE